MTETDSSLHQAISSLLQEQKLAVLATVRNFQPYSSLMAFVATDDLATIVTATGDSTRKHLNLQLQPRVSMLVDNRSNDEADFHRAAAITIIGRAEMVDEEEAESLKPLYLAKHPYLKDFLQSPSTTLFKITVFHYLMVTRFQSVMEYHLRDDHDIFA